MAQQPTPAGEAVQTFMQFSEPLEPGNELHDKIRSLKIHTNEVLAFVGFNPSQSLVKEYIKHCLAAKIGAILDKDVYTTGPPDDDMDTLEFLYCLSRDILPTFGEYHIHSVKPETLLIALPEQEWAGQMLGEMVEHCHGNKRPAAILCTTVSTKNLEEYFKIPGNDPCIPQVESFFGDYKSTTICVDGKTPKKDIGLGDLTFYMPKDDRATTELIIQENEYPLEYGPCTRNAIKHLREAFEQVTKKYRRDQHVLFPIWHDLQRQDEKYCIGPKVSSSAQEMPCRWILKRTRYVTGTDKGVRESVLNYGNKFQHSHYFNNIKTSISQSGPASIGDIIAFGVGQLFGKSSKLTELRCMQHFALHRLSHQLLFNQWGDEAYSGDKALVLYLHQSIAVKCNSDYEKNARDIIYQQDREENPVTVLPVHEFAALEQIDENSVVVQLPPFGRETPGIDVRLLLPTFIFGEFDNPKDDHRKLPAAILCKQIGGEMSDKVQSFFSLYKATTIAWPGTSDLVWYVRSDLGP
ncbi:hypothetical protein K491DRAFT_719711 [Lophiostoma macrostomum CBS 122681]|uniref:Uncharacterized protein n=1 Tax=Lophiostoma macrostomum CBS 122681 TaxID=1314788 RepID=A0A6A6SV22_9PLEO|nr:hypothetical protein K491DRAFT_719711 [Lophiostoma macrostomum CBS 122681]